MDGEPRDHTGPGGSSLGTAFPAGAVIEAVLAYLFARALIHVLAHRREHRAASPA